MTDVKEIGGYFELDPGKGNTPLPDGVLLNSGRNALRHIVRQLGIKRIHVPYYTCPVVWDALKAEVCELDYYEIDTDFYPTRRFPKDDFILYTNYFGCCGGKVDNLASEYPKLIVDCAQAYYAKPKGLASFSSARKFFGVPDGGVAYGASKFFYKLDDSKGRMKHLQLRAEGRTAEGYVAYRQSEGALDDLPILAMSAQTRKMLGSVDAYGCAEIRLRNFEYLDSKLKTSLRFHRSGDDVPMVYPYLTTDPDLRTKLIAKKIFVATYWPGVRYSSGVLQESIIPLPIDQRYGMAEMEEIIKAIKS